MEGIHAYIDVYTYIHNVNLQVGGREAARRYDVGTVEEEGTPDSSQEGMYCMHVIAKIY